MRSNFFSFKFDSSLNLKFSSVYYGSPEEVHVKDYSNIASTLSKLQLMKLLGKTFCVCARGGSQLPRNIN